MWREYVQLEYVRDTGPEMTCISPRGMDYGSMCMVKKITVVIQVT
jgi:hypothetical protein